MPTNDPMTPDDLAAWRAGLTEGQEVWWFPHHSTYPAGAVIASRNKSGQVLIEYGFSAVGIAQEYDIWPDAGLAIAHECQRIELKREMLLNWASTQGIEAQP